MAESIAFKDIMVVLSHVRSALFYLLKVVGVLRVSPIYLLEKVIAAKSRWSGVKERAAL